MNTALRQTVTIRKMFASDLDYIIRIEREIFLFPWSIGNFADSIKAGYLCQVMEQHGTIIGYGIMMVSPQEAHILTLGIAINYQNRGFGTRLIQHFIQSAQKEDLKSILLDVRESNHDAARLYRQIGFHQISMRKGYYPAMCGREDALVMQLIL